MIFKTFDSDIDKISTKWGMFGRSFNAIGDAIINKVADFNEEFEQTGKVISSWKNSDSIWRRLYPKKEDIQSQMFEVVPEIDENDAKNVLSRIKAIEDGVSDEAKSFQELYDTGDKTNQWIAEYAQATQGQIRSTEGVIKANQKARQSAIDHNKIIEQSTLAFKAKTLAAKALSLAMNIGLSLAINAAISLISSWVNAQENARKAAQEATDAFKEEANAIDDYIERATELRKELDKGNLSYEEAQTARSDLMAIQDALIEKYGEEAKKIDLVTGSITEQTKAIHDLKKAEFEDTYQLNRGSINSTIDQVNNKELAFNLYRGTSKGIFYAHTADKVNEEAEKIYEELYKIYKEEFENFEIVESEYSADFAKAFENGTTQVFKGDIYSLDSALQSAYQRIDDLNISKEYQDEIDEILTYISSVRKDWSNKTIEDHDETFSEWIKYGEEYSDDYYELIRQQENTRQVIANGTSEEIEQAKTKYAEIYAKMRQKALDNGDSGVIGWLERNGYSDFLNQFEEDADSVSNTVNQNTIPSIESLTTAYSALSEALDDIYDKQNKLTDVFTKIASGANLTREEILDLIDSFPELAKYVSKSGDGYIIDTEGLRFANNNLETQAKEQAKNIINTYEDAQKQLNTLQVTPINSGYDYQQNAKKRAELEKYLAEASDEYAAALLQLELSDDGFDEHQMTLDGIDEKYNNAKSAVDDYNSSIKTIDSAIEKMNNKQALTYDEMVELVEINPDLVDAFDERADGYYIEIDALESLRTTSRTARDSFVKDKIAETEALISETKAAMWSYMAIARFSDLANGAITLNKFKEEIAELENDLKNYEALLGDFYDGGSSGGGSDPTITAFEKELKYLDYLRDMGMISAKEYYKQLYFLNEKYYSDNADYLEQYRDNEVKIRDGITDIEIRAIDRQIEALETLKDKREEEKELQELQIELEEKKLELLNKQSQKNVRYYDADKREWVWTYNREDVADAQKELDEAQEALDEHLYQSNEDKKIEQLEQIKEILQGDEDNPNNPVQFVGSEGITTQATGRKVTFEEFLQHLGATKPIDTTQLWKSIYSTGVQPNVQTIAESTHNQNISTINNRNVQGNNFSVTINGSGLNQEQTEKAVFNALKELVNQLDLLN